MVERVPDPTPSSRGAVLRVAATGVCMSDWHGWMGHDKDIELPHVPGHELAGEVVALGKNVRRFAVGDRVTVPFVCGCGRCPTCASGNAQICGNQTQPGFTHWGSYAELVAIHDADHNLVALPDCVDDATAASLGCRFSTAYRALIEQGQVRPGQWLAVHGCGGVGLSAIMIAVAYDAKVVAVDPNPSARQFATELGAASVIDRSAFRNAAELVQAIEDVSQGGVDCSIDAYGDQRITNVSIRSLRPQGRHVQVGLMVGEHGSPAIPMDLVIAKELAIIGSHGMPAIRYPAIINDITGGRLDPARLIRRRVSLGEAARELGSETQRPAFGVTVIDSFGADGQ